MALAEWELFVNRFEKATRGNNTKAIAVGSQHCTSLFADSATVPVALTCYNLVKPKFDLFKEAVIALNSQSGTQGGDVLGFKQLIKSMRAKVDNWQALIKAVYPAGSDTFVALFPKGKTPFNSGTQQNKVDAVGTLIETIGSDASLAAVKALIETFYTNMLATFGTKDTSKETTKTDSTSVETARINMCIEMQGNFGLLTTAFKATPPLAAKYFDEALLRNILQIIFAMTIKVLTNKNIFKRTFAKPLTQKIQVTNNTNTACMLFLSDRKLGQIGLMFVIIQPLSIATFLLTDLGDPTTQTYLNIYNTNPQIKAKVVVKIL